MDIAWGLKYGLSVKQMAEKFNVSVQEVEEALKNFKGKVQEVAPEKSNNSLLRILESGFYLDKEVNRKPDACMDCGEKSDSLKPYYVDGNSWNDLVTNELYLCPDCSLKRIREDMCMPMAKVTVEGHFSAGHYLPSYDGACRRVHAHCWKYAVTVRGRINKHTGMVVDYKVLKNYLKELEDIVDHRMLNTIFPFEPTSENLAVWMWEYLSKRAGLKGLYEIKIYESEKCYTTLNAEDMLGSA